MNMPVLRQVRPNLGNATLWRRLRAYWREPVVYELAEACEVELPGIVGYDDAGKIVLLPRGFRCDLASTPRLAWLCGLRPDAPGLLLPGIVHDFYYRYGYFLSPSGGMLCAMENLFLYVRSVHLRRQLRRRGNKPLLLPVDRGLLFLKISMIWKSVPF